MGALTLMNATTPVDSQWSGAVEEALKGTAGEVTTLMLAVLVIGLGIFGLQWGVRKAMKFFKSTTN